MAAASTSRLAAAVLLGCLLAAALAAQAHAQLTATMSSDDMDAVKASAHEALKSLKGDKSLARTAGAAAVLGYLHDTEGAPCAKISKALNKAKTLTAVSNAVHALASLECEIAASDAAVALIQEGLDADSLPDLYEAVTAAAALPEGALTVDYASVVQQVADLMEDDGTFRSGEAADDSSALNAGKAYAIMLAAYPSVKDDSASKDLISAVCDSVGVLFATAAGSEDTALELGVSDKLAATSMAVAGALKLAAATGDSLDVTVEQLTGFAAYFLASRGTSDAATARYVIAGLLAIAKNPVGSPYSVVVAQPVLPDTASGDDAKLRVAVTNVFGTKVTKGKVQVTATRRGDEDEEVIVSGAMKLEEGLYEIDFLNEDVGAGIYNLQLSVKPKKSRFPAADDIQRTVKVTTKAKYGDASVLVSKGARLPQPEATIQTTAFPDSVSEVLSAGADQYLHVLVDITSASTEQPLHPHQVFLRLTNSESGVSTAFVAKALGDSSEHRVTLDIGDRAALHDAAAAGTYAMDLIIGDSVIENPVVWSLGSVSLSPPAAPAVEQKPLYHEPLLHESDTTQKALPEIHHQFREPEPRPASALSFAFTAAVIAPLAFLLIAVLRGANLKNLPSASAMPFALLFHGTIAAILGLYTLYWFQLNMIDTLTYLTPLALVAVFTGHRLLKSLAATEATATTDAKKSN